jgi:hypothetical protein
LHRSTGFQRDDSPPGKVLVGLLHVAKQRRGRVFCPQTTAVAAQATTQVGHKMPGVSVMTTAMCVLMILCTRNSCACVRAHDAQCNGAPLFYEHRLPVSLSLFSKTSNTNIYT